MQGLAKLKGRGAETEDITPEDVAQDEDYKRAVQSLEDQQHGRAGWLFARGALDKGDQAYLKEQEQLQRHAEEALQEREAAEFAAARALAEEQEERKRAEVGKVTNTAGVGIAAKRNDLKAGK
jgi:peptidoglycan hydrolase CwlO-like protein